MKKVNSIKNVNLFDLDDARNDVNYWINKIVGNSFVPFNDVFEIVEAEKVDINDLEDSFSYCEIGNLNKNGEVFPVELSLESADNENDDNSKLYKKIFTISKKTGQRVCDDIMAVRNGDILIAKTRPVLNKVLLVIKTDDMDYSKYYYTKAFITIRIKNKKISPIVGYYIIKNIVNNELIAISRIGKSGYPAIDKSDLINIRIPIDIKKLEDEEFNKQIESIHLSILRERQLLIISEREKNNNLNKILLSARQ